MIRWVLVLVTVLTVGCCFDNPHHESRTWDVSVIIEGSGTVTGIPADGLVTEDDTLRLEAVPNEGSFFAGWRIATGFHTENPLILSVEEQLAIRAVFMGKPQKGMVYIPARDSQFICGAATAGAPAIELPQHPVRLTHDFYMSAAEVTEAQFDSVMNGNASAEDAGTTPLVNHSWYDAVLYCNRRSIREGYDTVYSYSAVCEENVDCGYILENLTIHYDRGGYRLPTEAEWEYACRAGSDSKWFWGDDSKDADSYVWYFDNAGDTVHPVARKQPNAFGLYDMIGNVAEWVNDWLDAYADSSYVDPVGPLHLTQEQFEDNWERPIRGGSFHQSITSITSSTRKGPYEMPALGAQEDIGFRVVLGPFEAPLTAPAVTGNDSLSGRVICNKSDIVNCIGTGNIKVAFVYTGKAYKRYCAFADFSVSPVEIVRCGNDTTVNAPALSPDGSKIAYSSKGEGGFGASTITVRSVTEDDFTVLSRFDGLIPRWWVDPQSADTFIVYTTGASPNDQQRWYSEKTLRVRISGGKPVGEPDVLWESGSYHGGLSSDGRYLGTAFTRAKLVDLQVNDTNIYYFLPPWNGRNDTPQVCNLSMSPSKKDPGNALFLDFGYSGTSTLTGKSYRSHAIMFIGTTQLFTSEHIAGWFEVPAEYEQWNYPEWTNFPGAIITLAHNTASEDSGVVMLINSDDSLYCPLIRGPAVSEVAAWIDPRDVSETDDLYRHFGQYDKPSATGGQVVLTQKLRLFWHERERVSCVVIGNSPTMYGFDPNRITTYPAINIGWFQNSIGGSITVAQQYVLPHTPELEVLIIDLDAGYFTIDTKEGKYPRMTGLVYSNGYILDEKNDFYRDGIPPEVTAKIDLWNPEEEWEFFDSTGTFIIPRMGDYSWGEPIIEGHDYSLDDPVVRSNMDMLAGLIDSAANRGVRVIAVNLPQNPRYRETEMIGRAGPSHETWEELAAYLRTLEEQHDNFIFYDANNSGDHDYDDSMAFDTNHLNIKGGALLASRIDSLLQTLDE